LESERSKSLTLHLQANDVDAWWDRAVKAGAEIIMPLQVMFWGDKYGQLRDPYGSLGRLPRRPRRAERDIFAWTSPSPQPSPHRGEGWGEGVIA
jgi:hypothetical protein